MTAAESEKLFEVSGLLKKVPPVAGVVTDVSVYVTALRDYAHINCLLVNFLDSWTAWCHWKNASDEDVDPADLELYKETAAENFKELKDYIKSRAKEGWE